MGFVLRWMVALVLVAASWNPTPWNYLVWGLGNWRSQLPLTVLLGLLLFIGYVIYLRATLRSIGGFGMALVLAVLAALLWVLWDWGVIDLSNPAMTGWLGILAVSLVLGVGLSWSLIRRRLSGQADVDDVEA